MKPGEQQKGVSVEGIVARRNRKPYVLLFHNEKQIAQMSMGEARNFAHDILIMCSRTEADSMVFQFFEKHELPEGAASQLMADFRVFRFELDSEPVGKFQEEPVTDQFDFTKKKPQ